MQEPLGTFDSLFSVPDLHSLALLCRLQSFSSETLVADWRCRTALLDLYETQSSLGACEDLGRVIGHHGSAVDENTLDNINGIREQLHRLILSGTVR
jgi:hypothetical protein